MTRAAEALLLLLAAYLCTMLTLTLVPLKRATERMAVAQAVETHRLRAKIAEQDQAYSRYYHTAEATIKDLQAQLDRAKRRGKIKP